MFNLKRLKIADLTPDLNQQSIDPLQQIPVKQTPLEQTPLEQNTPIQPQIPEVATDSSVPKGTISFSVAPWTSPRSKKEWYFIAIPLDDINNEEAKAEVIRVLSPHGWKPKEFKGSQQLSIGYQGLETIPLEIIDRSISFANALAKKYNLKADVSKLENLKLSISGEEAPPSSNKTNDPEGRESTPKENADLMNQLLGLEGKEGEAEADELITERFQKIMEQFIGNFGELDSGLARRLISRGAEWSYSLRNKLLILIQTRGNPGGMVGGKGNMWNDILGWRLKKAGDPDFKPEDNPFPIGILGAEFDIINLGTKPAAAAAAYLKQTPIKDPFDKVSIDGSKNRSQLLAGIEAFIANNTSDPSNASELSSNVERYLYRMLNEKRFMTLDELIVKAETDANGKGATITGQFSRFEGMSVYAEKHMTPLRDEPGNPEFTKWNKRFGQDSKYKRKQYEPLRDEEWMPDNNQPDEKASQEITAMEKFITDNGINLENKELGGAGGYSAGDQIVIEEKSQGVRRLSTLIHECAHELLNHVKRRKSGENLSREQVENEAESTAALIMSMLGYPVHTSKVYLFMHLGREASKKIEESQKIALDTAKKIFDGMVKNLRELKSNRQPTNTIEPQAGLIEYFNIKTAA